MKPSPHPTVVPFRAKTDLPTEKSTARTIDFGSVRVTFNEANDQVVAVIGPRPTPPHQPAA